MVAILTVTLLIEAALWLALPSRRFVRRGTRRLP